MKFKQLSAEQLNLYSGKSLFQLIFYLNSAIHDFMGQRETLTTAVAIAIVVACVLVFDPFNMGFADFLGNYGLDSTNIFGRTVLGAVPLVGMSKFPKNRFYPNKRYKLGRKAHRTGSNLSVFKGRKASLNKAIFLILADLGPKSIIDLQKQLFKQKILKEHTMQALTEEYIV